jgi:hypothetical protein
MSVKPQQLNSPDIATPESAVPMGVRILVIFLRALFLGALVVIIARVSGPQSETIWSAYETPSDMVRLALGFAACLWLVIHMFMLPNDAEEYKSWLYLGPVVASLAWAIAIAILR